MQLASLIFFFRFREKQIMCRNICSHLTIFPLTHLITSFNESRKNLTDSKPKFQKTFLIRTLWNRDYKMFLLQKPLDGFVKALKQLFSFSKTFFSSLDRFQVWHLTWHFDEDFFLVSLFTIKIEFWSSKRFGM